MTRVRVVYLAAAALTAAALVLPLWGFSMSAPQYPDETLHLRVTREGIVGDVQEIVTLQHYIGVRFPTEIPELAVAVRVIAGLALALGAAALVGGPIGRAYRIGCAVFALAFLLGSAAAVQARLYDVGHNRDPHAPIRAVKNFTPPLVGPVKVGNFTVWSFPHAGGIALLGAGLLAIYGMFVKTDARQVRLKADSTSPEQVRLKADSTPAEQVRLKADSTSATRGLRLQPEHRDGHKDVA